MPWATLRARFPALNPAQLYRLLTQCQLASAMGPVSAWEPGPQDSPDAFQSEAVLESYENPPPIILPSEGFRVDLEGACVDDGFYQHLLYIRHFLGSLQGQWPDSLRGPVHAAPDSHPEGQRCALASRDPGDLPDPKSRATQEAQGPPDASYLLTPPSTPLGLGPGSPRVQTLPEDQRNGLGDPWGRAPEAEPAMPMHEHPWAPCSRSPSPSAEDPCCVFVVELERGPSGLGLGLIDGMHTPLGAPGLYVQTLLPGSPAARDGRLSLGDRLLEVNGTSLMGLGYRRAVDLIRRGGKKMRFLVAKSDVETAKKIRLHTPPS